MRSKSLRESGAAGDGTLLVAGGHDHPVAAHAIHRLAADARVDSMGTANVVYGDAPRFEVAAFDSLLSFMASIEGPDKVACVGVFEFAAALNRFPGGMEAVRRVLAPAGVCRGSPVPPLGPPFASERHLLEWAAMNARLMLERLDRYGVPGGPIFATGGWSRSRGTARAPGECLRRARPCAGAEGALGSWRGAARGRRGGRQPEHRDRL